MKDLKVITFAVISSTLLSINAQSAEIEEPPIQASDRAHWAFTPLERPPLPKNSAAQSGRNAIDLFILEALQEKDLELNEEADKRTLIRRLAFDLTGLPPSEEEIRAFESTTKPSAYSDLVERYLASPTTANAGHSIGLISLALPSPTVSSMTLCARMPGSTGIGLFKP